MTTTVAMSSSTHPCGCPRRLWALVPTDVADALVQLYQAGANLRRLAELSGLSRNTTIDVLHSRGIRLRRGYGRRSAPVATTFVFPPNGGIPANAHDRHRPECKNRTAKMIKDREQTEQPPRPRAQQHTYATTVVSLVIASNPDTELWTQEIVRRTSLQQQTINRILARMLDNGWLTDRREPTICNRGWPRHMFKPTPHGLNELREICNQVRGRNIHQQWLPEQVPVATDEGPGSGRNEHETNDAR